VTLDLAPLDKYADDAVRHFWFARAEAERRQRETGGTDHGERANVTAGKNMDGFVTLLAELAEANGMTEADVFTNRSLVTLPGYYRPTKKG